MNHHVLFLEQHGTLNPGGPFPPRNAINLLPPGEAIVQNSGDLLAGDDVFFGINPTNIGIFYQTNRASV